MQTASLPLDKVDSSPTKQFFVDMLTRDIELNDAILDLLDNCLDGVVRQQDGLNRSGEDNYYGGYKADIVIAPTSFAISDNCGGIPKDIARKYAFRMGRSPEDLSDEGKPTVGIYGIGMKRAIFKMGLSANITTKSNEELFCVNIPADWVQSAEWVFPIVDQQDAPEYIENGGTIIEITKLNSACASEWESEKAISQFTSKLISSVRQSYSFIIEKGFEITVNSIIVKANPIQIKFDRESQRGGIKPYMYFDAIDGVRVALTVGLYTSLPTQEEIEEHDEGKRSSDDAGWTVVCNDRVILFNDKSYLTGWGEAGVPKYHTQFISIKGLVFLESSDPNKLPTTTTKRGINMNSEIYAKVRGRMREGLKVFTSYTNRWKGRIEEEKQLSSRIGSTPVRELLSPELVEGNFGVQLSRVRGDNSATYYMPDLPAPENQKNWIQIRYSKHKSDVEYLCHQIFDDTLENIKAASVGEKCFDLLLEDLKSGKR
jgi:hypothetical protein